LNSDSSQDPEVPSSSSVAIYNTLDYTRSDY
jgi:hypothetical protein